MDNQFPKCAEFIDTYFPTVDGVVRTVHNYATLLNEDAYACVVTQSVGNKYVDNFTYDVFRSRSVKSPIKEYRMSMPGYIFNTDITNFLKSQNIDIFHAHSPFSLGLYAIEAGKALKVPVVATFHSKYYDDALQVTHSKGLATIFAKYVADFYMKADCVWACSEGTGETLRSYGYKGEIFVMDNGTDCKMPDRPEELKKDAIQHFGIDPNKPLILFVGHQIWQKNIKDNLDTAKLLMERGFDFQMVFAGSGYAENEIKKYAEEIGVMDKCVKFVGRIDDRNLLMGIELASDLFFFVSKYDNSPLVVREAASMKLPALLAAGSNSAEVINEGVNGFTCEVDPEKLADKIQFILSDKEKLKLIGENAAKTIGVPWSDIVPKVKDKYIEIIEKYKFVNKL